MPTVRRSGSDEITGNFANNLLNGGAGGDTLHGLEGDDTLIGGSAGDSLTGGAGADTFYDTAANLNFDFIADFTAQDRIVIADANFAGFIVSLGNSTLSYTGGQLTLGNISGGIVIASAAAGGGATLTVRAAGVPAPAYRWFRDGKPVEGAGAALTVREPGRYTVEVSNDSGRTVSAPVTVGI